MVRDGRDSVAGMLADQVAMSWFRPSVVNIETEFPNPFYGVEDESDRLMWPSLSPAGKCALRWRGAIRLAARLRRRCPPTSSRPCATRTWPATRARPRPRCPSSPARWSPPRSRPTTKRARLEQNAWRRSLTYGQLADIEKVAGEELRRLGYR